ncbi:alpha/beta hydrolase [Flammeovirga agarivorans]|uniref:Alpha/beta hydrolase n=1 Tax=Flammeovirga agarivorans TaxID=2726742 RepID=A0A7X8SJ60_9BACT|nr:alpha/beta hydrolase [Flammeovirga agarivorans]NLR91107.1 alpha/beta hydrolase [Flammeovirga agarivorans]
MKAKLLLLVISVFIQFSVVGQTIQPTEKEVYKTVDDLQLSLHIFKPEKQASSKGAIIFIHGGGWNSGSPKAFYNQAKHFADRGLVVFCPEYRVRKRNNTTIYEAVEDAQEAVAFVRKNAKKYGIKKNMIAIGGGSAGGHLAASTAFIDPLSTSITKKDYQPNLLLLFNPVLDVSDKGYGFRLVEKELSAKGIKWETFSPRPNMSNAFPSTLVQLGDLDKVIPLDIARDFEKRAQEAGVDIKMIVYTGAEHSFFNKGYGKKQGYPAGTVSRWYYDTLQATDDFLVEQNYLKENFKVEIPSDAIYPIRQ